MADILQEASSRTDEFQDPCKLWMGNVSNRCRYVVLKVTIATGTFSICLYTPLSSSFACS